MMRQGDGFRGSLKPRRAGKFPPAVLAGLLLAGCGSNAETGAGIYAERCLSCHGTVGAGDGGRAAYLPGGVADLRNSRFSAGEQRTVVFKGRKLMPAFGPALKKEEIEAVVAYIQGFK